MTLNSDFRQCIQTLASTSGTQTGDVSVTVSRLPSRIQLQSKHMYIAMYVYCIYLATCNTSFVNLQGCPFPWGTDAFPPCFRFPLFPKKISDSMKIFPNLTFSQKYSDFHPPKFLMIFSYFEFSPYFCCFSTFPPFRENYFPTTFPNFPPRFCKIYMFYILYVFFVSPLVWPLFMHHTMHILDDPMNLTWAPNTTNPADLNRCVTCYSW